jgi:hypothetical protein
LVAVVGGKIHGIADFGLRISEYKNGEGDYRKVRSF